MSMPSFKKTATPNSDASSEQVSRRSFVKMGIGFSAAITLTSMTLSGCGSNDVGAAQGMAYLKPQDVTLFGALMPAIANDLLGLPEATRKGRIVKTIQHIDQTCAAMGLGAQLELRKLLDMLGTPVLRWAVAGVRSPWHEATTESVARFLASWSASRFETLNAGRMVLVKLCCVSYYALPESRAASGYPGPQPAFFQAINS